MLQAAKSNPSSPDFYSSSRKITIPASSVRRWASVQFELSLVAVILFVVDTC